jgi:hypothetical protein
MHRKFIALILATAIAVTGLSAIPARADPDAGRVLAGLAALALIAAAVKSSRKDPVVSQNPTRPAYPTRPAHPIRQTPPRINRFDLPDQCLRRKSVNGRQRTLFTDRCLKNNYAFNGTLPNNCRLAYWDGRHTRTGYKPRCLRENGYRFARR